jgi:hypothetical protein
LKHRHAQGVVEYCQASNGYRAGTSGKKYNGICNKDLEKKFLPEYARGRKVYLDTAIRQREADDQALERENSGLMEQISREQLQLMMLGNRRHMEQVTITNPATGATETTWREVEDPSASFERQNVQSRISSLNYQLDANREKSRKLRDEINEMRTEAAGLQ